jgi:hypothetical protein
MAVAAAGCEGSAHPPPSPAALGLEEGDGGGSPSYAPPDDCRRFASAPPGALEALERLQEARKAAGLVPVPDLDPRSPGFAEKLAAVEDIPGYGMERLMTSRGCRGQLRAIHGWPYLVPSSSKARTPTERCDAFIAEWGSLWGMGDPGMSLVHERTKRDDRGGAHCIYRQEYYGVPVDVMRFVVHLDPDGRVTGANGEYIARMDDPPDPQTDASDALLRAQPTADGLTAEAPALVVFLPPQRGEPRLAWKVVRRNAAGMLWDAVWVSAFTGEVLQDVQLATSFHEIRQVYDYQWTDHSSVLRYQNHSPSVNEKCSNLFHPSCVKVRDNLELASLLWSNSFGRDSWDDAGGTLELLYDILRPGDDPCAIATGSHGVISLSVGITDLDVICHEAGHGMDSGEVCINCGGERPLEPGSVKEHFADVHGLWCNHTFGRADWNLHDCESDPAGVGPYVRRVFDDPPGNPETPGGATGFFTHAGPDSWRWYEDRPCGDGFCELGRHRNGGILNKVAYLLHRTGTTTHHGVQVEGLGFETAKWIFYDAMNDHLYPADTDMHEYGNGLRTACAARYGAGSHTCLQLFRALMAVGLWYQPNTVLADIGSRPAAYSWKGPDSTFPLHVFYKSATSNDIKWRYMYPPLNWWGAGPEVTVEVGGVKPQTDQAVAVARVPIGSGEDRLYVFYKQAGSNDIRYFRMKDDFTFEGLATIPTNLAQTDAAPAAATASIFTSVIFKNAGASNIGHVRMPNNPVGSWAEGPPPPFLFGTDTDPYLTDVMGLELFATAKQANGMMTYAGLTGEDWWSFQEPPNTGTNTFAGAVAPLPHYGNRQYAAGPQSEWGYGPPATDEVPTAVWWKSGMVLAHKEPASSAVRMHVLAPPRFTGHPGWVWGPSVLQPFDSDGAPVLVRAHHSTTGAEWSVGFLGRTLLHGNRYIAWTQSWGGQ